MKTLSVITVTYNAEHTVERTIRSVQEQTYPAIEHIIVDGHSSDGTVSLIKKHADKKTTWISEPDNGIYDAMNKAITMATCDYLCFLNAGDTFHQHNTVENMMHSIKPKDSPDIIYGETAIVDDNGVFLHMRRLEAPETLTWNSFKQGMLVCHQAFIVKRDSAKLYNLSYHFSSDFDWSIRMIKNATCIHNTRLILINYLNEGLTTANRTASLKERYRIMTKHYGHLSTIFHHLWFIVRAIKNPEK